MNNRGERIECWKRDAPTRHYGDCASDSDVYFQFGTFHYKMEMSIKGKNKINRYVQFEWHIWHTAVMVRKILSGKNVVLA